MSTSLDRPDNPEFQQISGQGAFGNLIAALNNINVQIDRLNALNDLTIGDVTVVNVEDILNNSLNQNDVRILNNVLNQNDVDIDALQNFLQDSFNNNEFEIIEDSLNDLDLVVTDVIAINVLSGGDVVVYVQ